MRNRHLSFLAHAHRVDCTNCKRHLSRGVWFVHMQDVVQDLKLAAKGSRSPYRREFVLPDGVSNFRGYVKVCVHVMFSGSGCADL